MKIKLLNFLAIGLSFSGLLFALPVAALPSVPSALSAVPVTLFGGVTAPGAAPKPAPVPANSALKNDACAGLSAVDSTQGCGATSDTAVYKVVKEIVNILSIIVGVAAVLVVIVSGFKYITSAGDAGKISSAKTTLIYAIVGLVVAALAQFLVHFVLSSTVQATVTCPAGKTLTSSGTCQ